MFQPLLVAAGMVLLLAVPAAEPVLAQQHVVIHVPRVTVATATFIVRTAPPPALVERKARDCVKVQHLQGFAVNAADSVDLVLDDGSLLRAKLGAECPALGFYNGAYIRTTKDNKLCAGRDSLRSRSGRSCAIQAFKKLEHAR